ncbi:spore germination protein [Cohnella caldifontis]|uniref:spore germination protein n=1 Tax=Cohnella caldifontis TaxID=3027471 RepID=UPI0023EBC53A|nr:spore germination protein [Cohnella sp. YIM B05605]
MKNGMKNGILKSLLRLLQNRNKAEAPPPVPAASPRGISSKLAANLQRFRAEFGNSSDLVTREMRFGGAEGPRIALVYLDGLTDMKALMQSLAGEAAPGVRERKSARQWLDHLKQTAIAAGEIKEAGVWGDVVLAVLSGETAMFVDGCADVLTIGTQGGDRRNVEEPNTQSVIRGPREGFTETLRTNTAMVRRKIRDVRVRTEAMRIGRVTQTDVAIMYVQGLAADNILAEVHARLNRIDTDGILESGYIEEFIQDGKYSPFPTVFSTERPDTIAAGLLEGRVAVFVDGTPFVLLVPALFTQFYQAPEDYYQRADFSTLLRLLRFVCFMIALLAPSVYIAVTTFHQELLPTPLLIGLAGQREGVPFPAFIEAVMMEIMFEILREGGVRMPKTIGQSVSIVGTLVIGQAAVEAGLVSPAMVIVVAITAISNFVIPAFNMAISLRMLRFLFMAVAASFGLFGVVICLIGLVLHLCSLKSFGVPYLAPFAPLQLNDQKDSLFRLPAWMLRTRPRSLQDRNVYRQPPKGKAP